MSYTGGKNLRIIRLDEVLNKIGLGRSTVYDRIKEGTFPQQVNLGARAVGWLEHEIDEWLMLCIANRDASNEKGNPSKYMMVADNGQLVEGVQASDN